MYNQFDIVQIITTKRIKYLSGPKNYVTDPHSNWSIVGFVDKEALIAKDQTLVKVPIQDIRKVGTLNVSEFLSKLKDAGLKHQPLINMPSLVSNELGISIDEAKSMLLQYNFSENVLSKEESNMIINRIRRLIERNGNN